MLILGCESLMYNRMINYINKYKLLYHFQFGFQKNHFTNMAQYQILLKITINDHNDITNVSNKLFLLLFADDSNAFITGKMLISSLTP